MIVEKIIAEKINFHYKTPESELDTVAMHSLVHHITCSDCRQGTTTLLKTKQDPTKKLWKKLILCLRLRKSV